jgi:tRNA (guanine-N7-)-methyltransferase
MIRQQVNRCEETGSNQAGQQECRRIKSYVLRAGRMSDAQRRSYNMLFPRYGIPFQEEALHYAQCFGNDKPLIIEIGFGMGTATAQIARQNPHQNYLGIEVHRPGIGRLLWEIENQGLENIRIIEYDGAAVLEKMIPDRTVQGFHVFFPDPWPKKRHRKRRLMTRPFTDLLAAKLRPSGYIYMATDWADYGEQALAELSAAQGLVNPYDRFAPPQEWRPRTKFEQKGLAHERRIYELFFIISQ